MSERFPNYEVLSEIGRGGMGIVYKAKDVRTGQIVAIKELVLENIDPSKFSEFKNRFRREASTAARLDHRNIVKVFEISSDPDKYYYVMEFLEGLNLRQVLATRRIFSLAGYWSVLAQLGKGLSYAHSMNVIHRDVKPDNIFILNDGSVKVTDFGIARVADLEENNLTKTGVMLGTLSYVSPEQLENAKTVDHRADIFSLGVVSYEALCGQLPFMGDGIAGTIVKIMSQEEAPLHTINKSIPVEISSAVSRALRKKPRDRYRSVQDFLKDFKSAVESITSGENIEGEPALQEILSMEKALESQNLSGRATNTPVDSGDTAVEFRNAMADQSARTEVGYQGSPIERAKEELQNREDELASTMPGTQNVPQSSFLRRTTEIGATMNLDKEGVLREKRPTRPPSKSSSNAFSPPRVEAPAQREEDSKPTYNPIRFSQTIENFGNDKKPLQEPTIVSYRSGRLILADAGTRLVHIFSREGRWLQDLTARPEITGSKTSGGRLTKPGGIALDERGRIFVCDSSDQYIRLFDNQGIFFKEFKNIKGTDGGLQGIAIDSAGLLYVSDPSNGCLQVFQSDVGVWMRSIAVDGNGQGMLQLPSGLAVDRMNRVYIVDYGTCEISIFNKSGALVRKFGEKGTEKGMFNIPRSIAVDRQDRIFVLDSLNHRIQVFGAAGDWLYSFGRLGTGNEEFKGPSSLTLDHENNMLYVADKGNRRVQVFELGFR